MNVRIVLFMGGGRIRGKGPPSGMEFGSALAATESTYIRPILRHRATI